MSRLPTLGLVVLSTILANPAIAGEVSGRVVMPSTCSPTISPAVVCLERVDRKVETSGGGRGARVALVNQRGLQFEPRVQAIQVGEKVRFTNDDNETHNVHILTPGMPMNQSMGRGQTIDFNADRPGLLKLVCDIHSHMRGFVLVSPTPYYTVCRPDGRFLLNDVAPGKYRLQVWHEMGQGITREIVVEGDKPLVVAGLEVEGVPVIAAGQPTPARRWAEVIDKIGVLLGESRSAASKPGGVNRARKLAEDAYFDEFEGALMETAVRRHLGYQRSGEIEGRFRAIRALCRDVNEGKATSAVMADWSRELVLALHQASEELNRLGVVDATRAASGQGVADASTVDDGDVRAQQQALAEALGGVVTLADSGAPAEAVSAMTSVYFDAFEPLERSLAIRRPQEIQPLEARFTAIRGRIGDGLKGEALAAELASLREEVASAIDRSRAGGTFLTAFFASLVTIVREGVEVILLLTMLIALVAKTGQPKALTAIRRGVAAAAVASVVTAVGLNLLVATAQARTREQIEGWVLMLAAGVLFYVSYWLISQSESKRWTDFLKEQVKRGVAAKGFGTLGLTAFLAVYREGAETALMYQAMISGQAGSGLGLTGVIAGLAVGLVGLGLIYRLIRKSSKKLPLRPFFQLTGLVLFAMAVVFAGNGVFELQSAGLLKSTSIAWLGTGLPWLGLHPNIQSLSIQGLLIGGAIVASLMLLVDRRGAVAASSSKAPIREHAVV